MKHINLKLKRTYLYASITVTRHFTKVMALIFIIYFSSSNTYLFISNSRFLATSVSCQHYVINIINYYDNLWKKISDQDLQKLCSNTEVNVHFIP